jgi:hypothetical protein
LLPSSPPMHTHQIVATLLLGPFLFPLFCVLAYTAPPPESPPCSQLVAPDGSTYDLTPLVAAGEQTLAQGNGKFTFAICKNLSAPCGFVDSSNPCGAAGTAGTCYCSTPCDWYMQDCCGQFTPSGIQPQDAGIGVFIQYTPVLTFWGSQYTTIIKILCDAENTGFQSTSLVKEGTAPVQYVLTINTIAGCPVTAAGLSGGAIFLIILLCLLVVYFVGGIIINKFSRQKEGIEVIPNYQFWFALPGLFKDGVLFVVHKTCRRSSYEKI